MEIRRLERPPKKILAGFRAISTSTISSVTDGLGVSCIINGLRPLVSGVRIAGTAFTIKAVVGERGTYLGTDFPVGEVINLLEKDDILVCDLGGQQVSTMGGLGSLAMKLRGAAGMVVDGGIRDAEQIMHIGFPAYTRHVCATTGVTRVKWQAINIPVEIGSLRVCPGDIVVADDTAVAVVPADKAGEILSHCQQREKLETQFEEELMKGGTFLEVSRKLKIM
ncbi:4-carboxy-4-hydroxy-2-oxoadipate aldolase [subsurface metagenome]